MAIIIVKNPNDNKILLSDLGKTIDERSEIILTEYFTLSSIYESDDLKSYVSKGELIINNGSNDLNIIDGLNHIDLETRYEDIVELDNIRYNNIIQIYNSIGGLDINTNSPIAIPFNNEIIKSTELYIHDNSSTNSSKIIFLKDGFYKIFYSINWSSDDNTNIKTIIRKNEVFNIINTTCYASSTIKINKFATNISSSFIFLNANDYIEVTGIGVGSKGPSIILGDACWIYVERFY